MGSRKRGPGASTAALHLGRIGANPPASGPLLPDITCPLEAASNAKRTRHQDSENGLVPRVLQLPDSSIEWGKAPQLITALPDGTGSHPLSRGAMHPHCSIDCCRDQLECPVRGGGIWSGNGKTGRTWSVEREAWSENATTQARLRLLSSRFGLYAAPKRNGKERWCARPQPCRWFCRFTLHAPRFTLFPFLYNDVLAVPEESLCI